MAAAEKPSKRRKLNDEEPPHVDDDQADTSKNGTAAAVPTSIIVQLQTMEVRENTFHQAVLTSRKMFVCRESTWEPRWTFQ